jgi:hypothetical protein
VNPLSDINLLALQKQLRVDYDLKGAPTVFDPLRRKYIRATPEEIVRQLWIIFFLENLSINPKLIAVERSIVIHGMKRRFDLVIFSKSTEPLLLIELKAPGVAIQQSVFDQIARYNMGMQVPYALVSNGEVHYCFEIDDQKRAFTFLEKLPLLTSN